jgi:drug/metabolite transporter (DMT)-like permease
MNVTAAVIAAIGCSLCNGISTVQQKIGADRQRTVRSFDLAILLRLLRDTPYVFGILLATIGYGLSLIALQVLPLFFVQSVIAASVMVTAFGERLILHRRLDRQTYVALTVILVGLALLSTSAVSGHATVGSQSTRLLIEILPIPLALVGLLFISVQGQVSALVLAALGGLSFGNTSTIGRILVYPHPLWRLGEIPLLYSLIVSAVLGQYLFTVALQRATATKSNAIMISLQTFGPAICGLVFFDDKIRSGFQIFALIGSVLVIIGSAATAVDESPVATI